MLVCSNDGTLHFGEETRSNDSTEPADETREGIVSLDVFVASAQDHALDLDGWARKRGREIPTPWLRGVVHLIAHQTVFSVIPKGMLELLIIHYSETL